MLSGQVDQHGENQYPRALVVLEVSYTANLDNEQLHQDLDDIKCSRLMWQKCVQSAPSPYANALAVLTWKDCKKPKTDEVASLL